MSYVGDDIEWNPAWRRWIRCIQMKRVSGGNSSGQWVNPGGSGADAQHGQVHRNGHNDARFTAIAALRSSVRLVAQR